MLELGALVPTRGLYLNTAHDDKIEELVAAARAEEAVASLCALTPIVDAMHLGPGIMSEQSIFLLHLP
ncbi:MAG: hypothetical protein RLW68_18865 [Devosia marina]|uniref:hypothetical protein n=1 Tax=Devosia marina TaxID=2683198 RepID=UPI0032EEEC3E